MVPVSISKLAVSEIKEIMAKKNIPPGYGLKMGIRGAGCVGVSYILGFDQAGSADEIYQIDGIQVLIEKKHMMYLMGMEVDFYSGADAQGFTFKNPAYAKD